MFLDIDQLIREAKEKPCEDEWENASTPLKVKPSPGFCVKTFTKDEKGKKVFINVCHADEIPGPTYMPIPVLMKILTSKERSYYRVPMSIGKARTENDKSGVPATVFDVVINSAFYKEVETEDALRNVVLTIVFEGLQRYQMIIDCENYSILKFRKAIGTLQTHKIRNGDLKMAGKLVRLDTSEVLHNIFKDKTDNCFVFEFYLPCYVILDNLAVEVGEDRVAIRMVKNQLVIHLPCAIDVNRVEAELEKITNTFRLKLPLKNTEIL